MILQAMKLIEPPTTNGLTNGVATNGEVTTNGDHEGSDTEWKVSCQVVKRKIDIVFNFRALYFKLVV